MLLRVDDVRLFVEVFGQEWVFDGTAFRRRQVLLGLHGGPGVDATILRHHLAPLVDAVQVVVPDQRGHGRSDHGTPDSWNLATWASDVRTLCEVVGVARPIVLGTSFGGFVAQQYAASYPEHCAALILVATAARFASLEETVNRFRQVGGAEAAEAARRGWTNPSPQTAQEWSRVCAPLLSRRPVPDPTTTALRAARISTMEVNHHFMAQAHTMDLRPALRRVRCPTLVVVGAHDPLIPVHLATEITEAIPGHLARIEVIDDAAHEVFEDNPKAVLRSLRDFLSRLG
jgi:pimeloyl-ACP methyl ester carboxylesterase